MIVHTRPSPILSVTGKPAGIEEIGLDIVPAAVGHAALEVEPVAARPAIAEPRFGGAEPVVAVKADAVVGDRQAAGPEALLVAGIEGQAVDRPGKQRRRRKEALLVPRSVSDPRQPVDRPAGSDARPSRTGRTWCNRAADASLRSLAVNSNPTSPNSGRLAHPVLDPGKVDDSRPPRQLRARPRSGG